MKRPDTAESLNSSMSNGTNDAGKTDFQAIQSPQYFMYKYLMDNFNRTKLNFPKYQISMSLVVETTNFHLHAYFTYDLFLFFKQDIQRSK